MSKIDANSSRNAIVSALKELKKTAPYEDLRASGDPQSGMVRLYVKTRSTKLEKWLQRLLGTPPATPQAKLQKVRDVMLHAFPEKERAFATRNPRTASEYLAAIEETSVRQPARPTFTEASLRRLKSGD